jgi:predicted ester cyclase
MKRTVLLLIASVFTLSCIAQSKEMENRNEIAKLYYEILDNGDIDKMDTLLSKNLIDHDSHGGNAVEEIKGLTLSLKNGFTDSNHNLEVVELIGDDRIFVRWRMTAKHTGEFFGVPASNKSVNFVGHDLLRVKDNKIVEIWHVENLLGMFEQMKSE